jgi:chromosome segregation ATPase
MRLRIMVTLFVSLLVLSVATGCQKTYYTVWEKLGKEKRHLLKDEVEKQRVEQEKASEEFKGALTRIKEIYGLEGGELEEFYNKLKSDYEACEARAEKVEKRIDKVEEIASDLFEEWENEIEEMSNAKFKSKSMQALQDTQKRYADLSKAMNKSRSRMETVLGHMKDYVLFMKHNLNAQSIGALRQEVTDIEAEVNTLINDIEKSVKEADDFLKTLG